MLSTQTRSSRVAICASEWMPTKYLKWLLPCLYMSISLGLSRFTRADSGCNLGPAAGLHPCVRLPCVLNDFTDVGVESEQSIWQTERIACVSQRGHSPHKVWASPAKHDIERGRAALAEVFAKRVGHRSQRLEDVGVVGLAADDEKDIRLLEPVPEADAGHFLHLCVRRIAAEIRRADRGVAQHFGDKRVGASAERRGEDRSLVVDHIHVALPLVGAQVIDLLLEIGIVRREQMRRQSETRPARIIAIEAALEVAGNRCEASLAVLAHADRIQLERSHAEVVKQLPEFWQLLNE